MPLNLGRRLIGVERSRNANLHLGIALCFIAGATNAGGFMAVQQYTSHMTGIVSAMADNIALGETRLIGLGLAALLSFMCGAALSAVMINFARRRHLRSRFALPLLFEALMLTGFGAVGDHFLAETNAYIPVAMGLLCFLMGLQNAVISKISHAEVRTTHLTGMITDLSIELGKLAYINRPRTSHELNVRADRSRLVALSSLIGSFFVGALLGAAGFHRIGFVAALPLAAILYLLSAGTTLDDVFLPRRASLE
jgi:uncharacterized membrane protein YoaK (UPF0700 family)